MEFCPRAAPDFSNLTSAWLPPFWAVTVAPVLLEELETALEGGMTLDLLASETSAPEDNSLIEPVEVLVPLPDTVYDPDILVTEAVAQTFYREVDQATEARDLTLQQMETVQQEVNTLFNAIGPNVSANPNLVDPNAGLTADELNSRNTEVHLTLRRRAGLLAPCLNPPGCLQQPTLPTSSVIDGKRNCSRRS